MCNFSSPAGTRADGSGACDLSGAPGCVLGGFSLSLLVAVSAPVAAATATGTAYGAAIPGALLDSAALTAGALAALPLSGLAPGHLARFAADLLGVSQMTAATSAALPPIVPVDPTAAPGGQQGRAGGLTNGGIAAICIGAIAALLLAVALMSWLRRRAAAFARMRGGASRKQQRFPPQRASISVNPLAAVRQESKAALAKNPCAGSTRLALPHAQLSVPASSHALELPGSSVLQEHPVSPGAHTSSGGRCGPVSKTLGGGPDAAELSDPTSLASSLYPPQAPVLGERSSSAPRQVLQSRRSTGAMALQAPATPEGGGANIELVALAPSQDDEELPPSLGSRRQLV
jgi:hypothetical protein